MNSGTEPPAVINDNVVCIDYSAATHGPLVAYRWDGEPRLTSANLVAYPPGKRPAATMRA